MVNRRDFIGVTSLALGGAACESDGSGLMRTNGLSALLLTGGTSLGYFTGVRRALRSGFAVVVLVSGDAFVVCPSFDEGRARAQIARGPLAGATSFLAWHGHESAQALVAAGSKDRGVAAGRVGVEGTVREARSCRSLAAARAEGHQSDVSRTFVPGTPTDRLKQVFEIELRAQTAALQAARPGVERKAVDAAARRVIRCS